jgi:hypothetical protein
VGLGVKNKNRPESVPAMCQGILIRLPFCKAILFALIFCELFKYSQLPANSSGLAGSAHKESLKTAGFHSDKKISLFFILHSNYIKNTLLCQKNWGKSFF